MMGNFWWRRRAAGFLNGRTRAYDYGVRQGRHVRPPRRGCKGVCRGVVGSEQDERVESAMLIWTTGDSMLNLAWCRELSGVLAGWVVGWLGSRVVRKCESAHTHARTHPRRGEEGRKSPCPHTWGRSIVRAAGLCNCFTCSLRTVLHLTNPPYRPFERLGPSTAPSCYAQDAFPSTTNALLINTPRVSSTRLVMLWFLSLPSRSNIRSGFQIYYTTNKGSSAPKTDRITIKYKTHSVNLCFNFHFLSVLILRRPNEKINNYSICVISIQFQFKFATFFWFKPLFLNHFFVVIFIFWLDNLIKYNRLLPWRTNSGSNSRSIPANDVLITTFSDPTLGCWDYQCP